jgi:hypothetical protein
MKMALKEDWALGGVSYSDGHVFAGTLERMKFTIAIFELG